MRVAACSPHRGTWLVHPWDLGNSALTPNPVIVFFCLRQQRETPPGEEKYFHMSEYPDFKCVTLPSQRLPSALIWPAAFCRSHLIRFALFGFQKVIADLEHSKGDDTLG